MHRSFLTFVLIALAGCSGSNTNSLPNSDLPANTPISQIQGAGAVSPFDNAAVIVTGIVSGDFQDNDADDSNNMGGFYLQSVTPDSDPATSEGIFVFDGRTARVDVAVGDEVVVEGTVNEHFGETQISAVTVTITGSGNIQPVDVNLPADLEQYEGMLIRLPQALTVAGLYELGRFGTVRMTAGGRPFTYTNQNPPDVAGYAAHRAELASRSIFLDDGRLEQNRMPIRYLSIRSGDAATALTGNLRYSRGSGDSGTEGYRLVPTVVPQFESRNPRPPVPDRVGSLRVVGFNTLNFFSTVDSGQDNCGPSGNRGCRGADSAEELERQLAKLTTTLDLIDADVVGLMEIQNNRGIALQMIVDRLNAVNADSYDWVDTGLVGTDVITTAFIYKSARVSVKGDSVVLDSTIDMRFNELRNRPSLAQAFTQISTGAVFTVVVNHLKSKGSSCDDVGDPNGNDGQDDCNLTRTQAAAALAEWLATDPTGSGDDDYLVIGDFNAFVLEDPLTALKDAGLTNLLEASLGGNTWSSVYAGESGALDHAFASPSLLSQIVAATDWHINADEPTVLDYNLEYGRDPALFDASIPYRTSDHDPIIIDLALVP